MPEPIHIPEVLEPEERIPRDLVALRRFAFLMDQAFEVPGTRLRFGADAVIGLIPGVGDIVGALLSTWIIAGALRHRVAPRIVFRMVINVAADLALGAIPVAGDVWDFLFDANIRNLRLLEANRNRELEPRSGAKIAWIVLALGTLIVLIPVAILVALALVALWSAGRLG